MQTGNGSSLLRGATRAAAMVGLLACLCPLPASAQVAPTLKKLTFQASYKEALKRWAEEGGAWYEVQGKDAYQIQIQIGLKGAGFDPATVTDETMFTLTFGDYAFELPLAGFKRDVEDPMTKYNSLRYNTKSGTATFVTVEEIWTDTPNGEGRVSYRKGETVTVKWTKDLLQVTVLGTPAADAGMNLFDFSGDDVGPLAGQVETCAVTFGPVAWEGHGGDTGVPLNYKGSKTMKTVTAACEPYELTSWSVKGVK